MQEIKMKSVDIFYYVQLYLYKGPDLMTQDISILYLAFPI